MKELKVMYQACGESHWLGTLAADGRDVLFQYSPDALTPDPLTINLPWCSLKMAYSSSVEHG